MRTRQKRGQVPMSGSVYRGRAVQRECGRKKKTDTLMRFAYSPHVNPQLSEDSIAGTRHTGMR